MKFPLPTFTEESHIFHNGRHRKKFTPAGIYMICLAIACFLATLIGYWAPEISEAWDWITK